MRRSGRGTVGDVPRTSDQSKALFAAASPVAVALSVAVGHRRPSDRVRNSVTLTKFLTGGGGGVFSMV